VLTVLHYCTIRLHHCTIRNRPQRGMRLRRSPVSPLTAAFVGVAGVVAGGVNAVAGGGSLLTFPVLLAAGLPPVAANVTNTLGVVPGSIGGSFGYRKALSGQRRRVLTRGLPAIAGALVGCAALLTAPAGVFKAIVPALVAGACVLLLLQPRLARSLEHHRSEHGNRGARIGIFFVGVYGGYFGAAIGVMLLGLLGLLVSDSLQRLNALKNVMQVLVNGISALVFAVVAPVHWVAALALALGTVVGGRLGATVAQRIPDRPLRLGIALVGLVVAGILAVTA
jgi:uncharacterized membrane protein YfcA